MGSSALLKEFSQPRDRIQISYVSCIGRWVLYHERHLENPCGPLWTLYYQEGMKPHNSKIESPSGLSWAQPPLFWLPLDLEGFLFYPQLWEGWSITLGLLAPVRMLSSAVALLTAAVEGRAGAVHGGRGCSSDFCLGCNQGKFNVPRGGGIGWQGTGTPPPQEPFCLPLLCAPPQSCKFL